MESKTAETAELLQWWHQQQLQTLKHEAELIRNGLMQEVFAMRRQLELSCERVPDQTPAICSAQLADLEKIYTSLACISDRLDSPYLQDSLPLALGHLLQPWQSSLNLRTHFPADWHPNHIACTHLLLFFTNTLCQCLAAAEPNPLHCTLRLTQTPGQQELFIQATFRNQPSTQRSNDIETTLAHVVKTFTVFTQGDYVQTLEDHASPDQPGQEYTLSWRLSWETI